MPPLAALGAAAGISTGAAAGIAGGVGLLSGIAGAQGTREGVNLNNASDFEGYLSNLNTNQLKGFESMVNRGAAAQDVENSANAQRDFASQLKDFQQNGALPNQMDISKSNDLARALFQSQQMGLNQSFQDQNKQFARNAALTGRGMNDPVLANMMAQEQTRQQGMLNSQQGGLATQLAMQQPMQRLQFGQQRLGLLAGLSDQAMANRQSLLSMGNTLMSNERDWRYKTSDKTKGGGAGGFITGMLGGFGSAFGGLQGLINDKPGSNQNQNPYQGGMVEGPQLPPGGLPSPFSSASKASGVGLNMGSVRTPDFLSQQFMQSPRSQNLF